MTAPYPKQPWPACRHCGQGITRTGQTWWHLASTHVNCDLRAEPTDAPQATDPRVEAIMPHVGNWYGPRLSIEHASHATVSGRRKMAVEVLAILDAMTTTNPEPPPQTEVATGGRDRSQVVASAEEVVLAGVVRALGGSPDRLLARLAAVLDLHKPVVTRLTPTYSYSECGHCVDYTDEGETVMESHPCATWKAATGG